MTSRSLSFTLLLLTILLSAAGTGIGQATDASAPGVYLLVEVNGRALPSISWTTTSQGRSCGAEALGGTMLLDSFGRMATLLTQREVCTDQDGSRTTSEEESEIFIGSYELTGEILTLHWETPDLGDDECTLNEGRCVITDVGEFDYEGQTTQWTLQKTDS